MEYVKEKDILISYNLAPEDRLFYCPYNRSHQVREFRAASHLEVCRRAYLKTDGFSEETDKIVTCQWLPNKHHLRLSSIKVHEKVCEGNNEQLYKKFQTLAASTTVTSTGKEMSPTAAAAAAPENCIRKHQQFQTKHSQTRNMAQDPNPNPDQCKRLTEKTRTNPAKKSESDDDEWED